MPLGGRGGALCLSLDHEAKVAHLTELSGSVVSFLFALAHLGKLVYGVVHCTMV